MAMLKPTQRHVAPIVAVVVALSVGGIGIAYGSSHPSAHPANKAKGKRKNHVLSVDYKTSPVSVIDEPGPNTVEFSDDAKLVGRPFGNRKAHLDEDSLVTYNQPQPGPDFSGTEHTTFRAIFYSGAGGGFRGFYDYSLDSNGQATGPITGVITGGGGMFRGATGSFQVVDLVAFHPEAVQYRAHWQGSIRY
jgi:hypothetical protein